MVFFNYQQLFFSTNDLMKYVAFFPIGPFGDLTRASLIHWSHH
jgi:hypothetical protein